MTASEHIRQTATHYLFIISSISFNA